MERYWDGDKTWGNQQIFENNDGMNGTLLGWWSTWGNQQILENNDDTIIFFFGFLEYKVKA